MSWTTSNDDLRKLLSDGPADKYAYRKKVFGDVNGTNKTFKTFEFRRVTDFTTSTGFLGFYVNGTKVTVTADDLATGEFTATTAPAANARVQATYYFQWFTDDEINEFVQTATQWLGLGDSATVVPSGLQPAALKYASGEAYQKLSVRWAINASESFRLEDSPDPKNRSAMSEYADLAKQMKDDAAKMRDDFYKRQGQYLAPLFATIRGRVREVMPKR